MRIFSVIRLSPIPEKRKEILSILRSVKGPTQAKSSCLDCRICEEDGDDGVIVFMEQWLSWEAFMQHIRSDIYARVLEAMELSRDEPDVCFFEVTAIKGMEFLRAVREKDL
jgi:quinol monooxygenase YgiN